jgi:hypothetical protein
MAFVQVMWLLGRRVPDDKVIADFRKDNGPARQELHAQQTGAAAQAA